MLTNKGPAQIVLVIEEGKWLTEDSNNVALADSLIIYQNLSSIMVYFEEDLLTTLRQLY